jgi:hypothetical protein
MRTDPAETRALFRYHVVADALGPRLTPAERGALVRQLARQSHVPPDGTPGCMPEPPWTAGSAPIGSRAWTAFVPSHGPTWG